MFFLQNIEYIVTGWIRGKYEKIRDAGNSGTYHAPVIVSFSVGRRITPKNHNTIFGDRKPRKVLR